MFSGIHCTRNFLYLDALSYDSLNFQGDSILSNLSAGDYDLFILDTLGCLAQDTFVIVEPEEISITVNTVINVKIVRQIQISNR